ncbi:hypothetical protein AJ78_08626 [Emergomyces pasteurianus Ep9510]|uniref:HORMA domain-containing protein n=1 Tax=Emergomyces pasteurianus Ep9510 TaxID=1447872 RepID=A0A1J9P2B6_9EURO|nr:hypothetical protein AJ78_08626 [Emergomyces pasteurianus Ep9510]
MARVIFTGAAQPTTGTQMASRAPAMTATTVMKTPAHKEKQQQQQQQSQGIRQDQSLALVQIMLHASFGTLFYLREFLPLNCFDERDLMKLSKPDSYVSYANFVEGKPSSNGAGITANNGSTKERRAQPLKIIVRGKNPKADKLLDLLEHGIFDAIEKNFLEAVQMTIFVDKTKSSHVLESYTFTFKYESGSGCKQTKGGGDDVGKRLASISLESTGCTADMKTVKTARRGLEMIIRRLITLSTFLPMLPSERYMEIHLFYTDGSPAGYEPPGFKAAEHNDLLFARNEMWSRETQSCGVMETGVHSVGLKICSLKWSGTNYPSSEYVPEIPADIEYGDRVRRDEDIGFSDVDTAVRDLELSTQGSSQISTQTRQDEALRKDFQKMIPLATSTPGSDFIPTQCNPDSFPAPTKPQLSQVKLSQLGARSQIFSAAATLHYGQGREQLGSDHHAGIVRCECGSSSENSGMLKCAFCKTRQHLTCYGFVHEQDAAIPETHACYKCLLEPHEMHLVQDMRTLVLLRQALRVIIEEGYPNRVRDFAQKLGCNGQTIVQITDMLRKQGFLHATPGSKSKGFLEKGLPKFTLSTEFTIKEKLRNEIFNPLAKISHHYALPPNKSGQAGQCDGSATHTSDISSDVLSIEEIPPQSSGCEQRRGESITATNTQPTEEVNEIRTAWKELGSSLEFIKPAEQPNGTSEADIHAKTQSQAQTEEQKQSRNRSIMGGESSSRLCHGSSFNGGKKKQARSAEWVRDEDDYMIAEGSHGADDNNTCRKRIRLSMVGSPISIFEPTSESAAGSGSEDGSGNGSGGGSV